MKAVRTLDAINRELEGRQDREYRAHLGGSVIGKKCAREVWYGFRWSGKEECEGKLLRLFDRGNEFEPRAVEWLRIIGAKVWTHDETKSLKSDGTFPQYRISDHNGHFGGSLDGVGINLPDLPKGTPFLCEFKTHNDKSFKQLEKEGLCSAKPQHFTQCQVYMFKMGLPWALYLAINKNDDDIFPELIQANPFEGQRHIDRAGAIINADSPPKRISERSNWFECTYCDFRHICHERVLPDKTCRSCANVRLGPFGSWVCGITNSALSLAMQAKACGEYKILPGFLK